MIDIQYDIIIMGGREVSRPYRVGFYVFCFSFPRHLSTEAFSFPAEVGD